MYRLGQIIFPSPAGIIFFYSVGVLRRSVRIIQVNPAQYLAQSRCMVKYICKFLLWKLVSLIICILSLPKNIMKRVILLKNKQASNNLSYVSSDLKPMPLLLVFTTKLY